MIKNIYKGRVVTLNLETVTLPNGLTVELEVVRHPGAAAIVPMKPDGTVVLVQQYRYAGGGFLYEIPAGKLLPGEDPQECALRELEEETGYRAGSLESLLKFLTAPSFTDEIIHIYMASNLSMGHQKLDHDECLDIVEMPIEQAMDKIYKGMITDAKTIIGLHNTFNKFTQGHTKCNVF
ncbi:MAG TPA: NUDIX hydrolase [Nitrospiraceae bacterium]|nr:NUDIX hydrolase [Nitrospiraceae bacterium]